MIPDNMAPNDDYTEAEQYGKSPDHAPLDGTQRMREVDDAVAKNLKHLEAARNSLHRVTFIGIGPDGMREVCDMLDDINEMIEHLLIPLQPIDYHNNLKNSSETPQEKHTDS